MINYHPNYFISLSLVRQPVQDRGDFKFKPDVLRFKKLTLCHILLVAEGLGTYLRELLSGT